MNLKTAFTLTAVSLALSACASLNSVSVTPIPAARDHQVSATSERMIILGLNFDNDFADQVSADLSRKCPGGKISGILTKDESYMYFLFFVMKRKVTATGYCGGSIAMNDGGGADRRRPRRGRRVQSVEPELSADPQ